MLLSTLFHKVHQFHRMLPIYDGHCVISRTYDKIHETWPLVLAGFLWIFPCIRKSHFSLARSLIASSSRSVSNFAKPSMDDLCFLWPFPQKRIPSVEIAIHFFLFWGHRVDDGYAAVDSCAGSTVGCFLFSIRDILVN